MQITAFAQGYIPPDIFHDEHLGRDILRRNDGQVFGTDGHDRRDVRAYFEGSPLGIYLRDSSRVSFTYHVMHHDSTMLDTSYRVDMAVGATKFSDPELMVPAPGVSNYYRGASAVEEVPAFRRGIYWNVINKIDLHVYGSTGGPRIAYVVRPGGNPGDIKLVFSGQDSLGVDWQGALKVYMQGKWIELRQAIAYQVDPNGNISTVNWTAGYEIDQSNAVVHFTFDAYNENWPLVLEIGYGPMAGAGGTDTRNMNWSTYMGGMDNEELTCTEADNEGNPYFCGYSFSVDFPVAPGNQVFNPFLGQAPGWDNAVLMKFDHNNKQLVWATYFGGSDAAVAGELAKTEARKIAVYNGTDPELDNVFATGTTNCNDLQPFIQPLSAFVNADQQAYTGGIHRMWVGAFIDPADMC